MQLILLNIMEEYVIITLDEMLPFLDGCKCERCRLDIASYTLNRLKPKYVATTIADPLVRPFNILTNISLNVVVAPTAARETSPSVEPTIRVSTRL